MIGLVRFMGELDGVENGQFLLEIGINALDPIEPMDIGLGESGPGAEASPRRLVGRPGPQEDRPPIEECHQSRKKRFFSLDSR